MATLIFSLILAIFIWEIGFTIGAFWAAWTTTLADSSWDFICKIWKSFAWPYYFPLYVKNKYNKK